MACRMSLALFTVLASCVAMSLGASGDFYLGNREYRRLRLCTEGDLVAPGVAIVTNRQNATLFYKDDANRLRSRDGDYCVIEQGGYLVLGTCGGVNTDWLYSTTALSRFYTVYRATNYATWESKSAAVNGGSKFISKPYDAQQRPNDMGAGWAQQFA